MNKRHICLLLAIVLCLSMTACKREQQTNPTNPNMETTPITEPATPAADGATEGSVPAVTDNPQTSTDETVSVPQTPPTLPPDIDATVGVVDGEGSSDIESDSQDETVVQKPTDSTTPTEPEKEDSQIDSNFDLAKLTYEGYIALSGADQRKVMDMFGSAEDFIRWYKAVEAIYKAAHPDIEIGDENVKGEDIAG